MSSDILFENDDSITMNGTAIKINAPVVADGGNTGEGVVGTGKNGVHGQSSSSTDSGVWGDNIGDGYGVSGSTNSPSAAGVWGNNQGGAGVAGSGKNGVVGQSSSSTDSGVWGYNIGDGYGVSGSTNSPSAAGVWGNNQGGAGVIGSSAKGYGGDFRGGLAPLRLEPSSSQGPPQAASGKHSVGELYVDNQGALYFCQVGGTPGTWKKVRLV